MSFLGEIGNFFSGAVKTVVSTVTNPAKLTTAVLTGGLSVVAPNLTKPLTNLVGQTLYNPNLLPLAAGVLTGGGLPASLGVSSFLRGGQPAYSQADLNAIVNYTGGQTLVSYPTPAPQPAPQGGPMAFNIGNLISGAVSGIGSLLTGGSPSSALQNFTSQAFLPSPANTYPQASPFGGQAYPVAAAGGQAMAAARAVATVGRSFFNKYPNLATVIQGYRNMGKNVTRAKLYSLLKRFGPELLISGGILTAAAVSELMVAGPGRRRMNPGNVKALRRSLRRLESFHHLCQRADKLRRPSRRSSARVGRGTQQFVRQG